MSDFDDLVQSARARYDAHQYRSIGMPRTPRPLSVANIASTRRSTLRNAIESQSEAQQITLPIPHG